MAMTMYLCVEIQILRFFALIGFLAGAVTVYGQNGFVSIDCGTSTVTSYTDTNTGIVYTPDSQYIDTGISYEVSSTVYIYSWYPKQVGDLRSFPNGSRNCYTIKDIHQGGKYLIRGSFLYGNYDGRKWPGGSIALQFNLYIGVNFWDTVNIRYESQLYFHEIVTIATADYFSICLENTQSGTPFISALELRTIDDPKVYADVTPSTSLALVDRLNFGARYGSIIRYPSDAFDRTWIGYETFSGSINTTKDVQNRPEDSFKVPIEVMNTASTPTDNTSLWDMWISESLDDNPVFYMFMHFAELFSLQQSMSRSFNIFINHELKISNFTPEYLLTSHVNQTFQLGTLFSYTFNITRAAGSTLPPILNAFEVYRAVHLIYSATDRGDVEGMMELKELYDMKSWQGDPCTPRELAWHGVDCNSSGSNPPIVTTLNLSSLGLTGGIPTALGKLKAIKYLDLSNNKLSGSIPSFLADLPSLIMLNLSRNQLDGSIPDALLRRKEKDLLDLQVGNNPNLCQPGNNCTSSLNPAGNSRKSRTTIVIAAVIPTAFGILIILFIVFLYRKRQKLAHMPFMQVQPTKVEATLIDDNPLRANEFTYLELKTATNNFKRILGRGGSGTVYYGCLRDEVEVAIKTYYHKSTEGMSSETISEESDYNMKGSKEFRAEALILSRVHHRNLVSLIGICKDIDYLALLYEYMPQGSLRDHLIDRAGEGIYLGWKKRIEIAVDAAQGLEYLHNGCTPPIIHRDVKTCNILLSTNFEAKIADFGLSKAFHTDVDTHVSTNNIVGTLGYLDPEYHKTFQLTEKSDVYSFGVVLMELITGLPAVLKQQETCHIVQWVHNKLSKGDVTEVVDARLDGKYDINSLWKVADIATRCTKPVGRQRPSMSEVVKELKESLHGPEMVM